jgi:gluconokinase
MGVSGSGKSTVGAALAKRLGWRFIEGDQFHPPQNREKMAAGIPLDDHDRRPWVEAFRAEIDRVIAAEGHAVVACSALKRRYRQTLRDGVPGGGRVVFLHGSRELLLSRVGQRKGHFFPADLLDSQLNALEPPTDEPGSLTFDIAAAAEDIAQAAAAAIGEGR